MLNNYQPPAIPKCYGHDEKTTHWGQPCVRHNTLATSYVGDGLVMLWISTLCNRPSGWIIRVDSSWALNPEHDPYEVVWDAVELLEEEFSSFERLRECYLEEGLSEDEIWEAGHYNHPVVKSDVGIFWEVMRVYDGRRWVRWPYCGEIKRTEIRNKVTAFIKSVRHTED